MVQGFLLKYAEIGIKGKNRYKFENALCEEVELLEQFFLNFTLFIMCCFLPVTPQPLTGIEQMIY